MHTCRNASRTHIAILKISFAYMFMLNCPQSILYALFFMPFSVPMRAIRTWWLWAGNFSGCVFLALITFTTHQTGTQVAWWLTIAMVLLGMGGAGTTAAPNEVSFSDAAIVQRFVVLFCYFLACGFACVRVCTRLVRARWVCCCCLLLFFFSFFSSVPACMNMLTSLFSLFTSALQTPQRIYQALLQFMPPAS